MHVSIIILVLLTLLAAPTAIVLTCCLSQWARTHGLCLIGSVSRFNNDEGTYVERWCLFYVPLLTKRGFHSTSLAD